MATLVTHRTTIDSGQTMTAQGALRYAWFTWLAMLAVPAVFFLYVVWSLMGEGLVRRDVPLVNGWFLSAIAYMVIVPPLSFFARSRLFHSYWKGQNVQPRSYLKGMAITWIALEIGGLYSLVGALVTRSLLPNLFPALAAFMMFVVLWPTGRAMTSAGCGASDDPQCYEEPR